ncbi:MAG TPA: hypothetical protein VN809_00060, partial [Telmatospirillum sp.]|nr:hypothetical protein [Telmatospirillum sp.]
ARRADEFPRLPKLTGTDFDRLCVHIEDVVPPGEADYYSLVVLSRELVKHRNWLSKLERLVSYTHPDQRDQALTLLDGVFADLFGVATALQDFLGYQRNLADALCAIVDLCEGRFVANKSDAKDQIAAIAPLIADGRLAETRKSLMDRMLRQLASAQPLSRNDPSLEREAFRRVAFRLFRSGSLIGGADTAEALTRRFVFMQEAGGRAGLRVAVGGVVALVADPAFAVSYLLDLAGTPLGGDLFEDIAAALRRVIGVRTVDALVAAGTSVQETLLRVTGLYDKIAGASGFPETERRGLLDHLDRLLCRYLEREGVIEKLDDPKALLRDRATRLIEFCASELLPVGSKAVGIARARVVALLKQPNFEVRFVDGLTDAAGRDEALRVFHALMARAGFR